MLASDFRGTARPDVMSQRKTACPRILAPPNAGTVRTRIVGVLGL